MMSISAGLNRPHGQYETISEFWLINVFLPRPEGSKLQQARAMPHRPQPKEISPPFHALARVRARARARFFGILS